MTYIYIHVKQSFFLTSSLLFFSIIGCMGFSQETLKKQTSSPSLMAETDLGAFSHPYVQDRGKDSLQKEISLSDYGKWWENFGSPELNELIETALGDNFSLGEAWARLRQAKASENSRRASLFPIITYSGSVSQRESGHSKSSDTTFSAGPAASYEVDLWGSVEAGVHEYRHKTLAARFDLESAAMSVAAEVAQNWFALIAVREELSLLQKQVEINTMVQELLELRFENAMSTALDVLQQREVVARTRARIPPVKKREINLTNALSLLTGRMPGEMPLLETVKLHGILHQMPAMPESGLPSDLLIHRPDIKAAHMRWVSSQWNRLQVQNERLPSLKLTGSFLLQHTRLETLLKNWILSLAAQMTGDLFDGGAHRADLDLARGSVEERLVQYRKTVYTAIIEVENGVVAEKSRKEWIVLLQKELEAAKLAMKEARNRYIQGLDPFLPFVTEQINVQNLELSLLQQQVALFQDRVALYRALGGDWTETLTPQSPEARVDQTLE